MLSNNNDRNFHSFSQLICRVVIQWDDFVQHGELLCKQTAKSYWKGVWVICAKPLLWIFCKFLFLTSFSSNRMSSFTEFATKPYWCQCNLNNRVTDSYQGNNYISGLEDRTLKRSWSSYMTSKCTSMNVCKTFSKKKKTEKNKSILGQRLQCFQTLPLAWNHCIPLQKIYLHTAERYFLSLVSVLKSLANGHFLKVVIDKNVFLNLWQKYTNQMRGQVNDNRSLISLDNTNAIKTISNWVFFCW